MTFCVHQWDCVLYNAAGHEVGWICKICGLNAQKEPEEKNMEEFRNGKREL